MSRKGRAAVLEGLCDLSMKLNRRILTCERKGYENSKVSAVELGEWFDCVVDAIEEIDMEEGGSGDGR